MISFCTRLAAVAAIMVPALVAVAQPTAVEHNPFGTLPPSNLTFTQPPGFTGAVNERTPLAVRENESATIYFRVSFQNTYDRVCVYYTTDGTEPAGSFGSAGNASTQILRNDLGSVSFVANQSASGTRDWWKATLPISAYGASVKYKLSAWKQFNGGEVFANAGASSSYTVKLAWPGAGNTTNVVNNQPLGYPNLWFWKEEGVVGNGSCNIQLDQNGNFFDIYFPGAGGVYGVGTKNEGYVDGLDTFPAGLPLDNRGQMHINQVQTGLRVGNTTYWLSNKYGNDFVNVSQSYVGDTQTIKTTGTLVSGGANLKVEQYDYAPKGLSDSFFTSDVKKRGWAVKRMILTNNNASSQTVNVYLYCDAALNGGDIYDGTFTDTSRNVMVHYDNTYRFATGNGQGGTEYKLLSGSGNLEKNDSVYLGFAMKSSAVGGAGGTPATDRWSDSSSDQGQGWIGQRVVVPAGQAVEVSFLTVTGYDNFAGATGTYNAQMAPVVEAFYTANCKAWMETTDSYWTTWLNNGVTIDTPDASINKLFNRGLLGTALHIDGPTGSVIAGFHNGAYPYVWPRDAVYAAITFARTDHLPESKGVYDWMKNTAYRDFESWGRKGFWYQKYSTDGYKIWDAPQIDETAVFPWGVYYHYLVEGDQNLLTNYLEQVRDAVQSTTRTSSIDPTRLKTAFGLMYSNNVWEDSYDTFIYSNANVVRGLQDAARIFNTLGLTSERDDANAKATSTKSALDARIDWNGENTDVSFLGASYPFETYAPNDNRVKLLVDRINGVANDRFGNNHPLVYNAGEFNGLIGRYWGDGYWNGGPWFLSTLWYGCYYAQRQDYTAGKGDIDNHYYRLNQTKAMNGNIGFGAEQMSPSNSLLYSGQSDFRLQTAWPNAWESMSTYVDSVMMFLDFTPDAPGNTLRIEPKLPTAWSTMSFRGLRVGSQKVNVSASESTRYYDHFFLKQTAGALNFDTVVRIPAGKNPCVIQVNGVNTAPASVDTVTGRVRVTGALSSSAGGTTLVRVGFFNPSDLVDGSGTPGPDGQTTASDVVKFFQAFFAGDLLADIADGSGSLGGDGQITGSDVVTFFQFFFAGCN